MVWSETATCCRRRLQFAVSISCSIALVEGAPDERLHSNFIASLLACVCGDVGNNYATIFIITDFDMGPV